MTPDLNIVIAHTLPGRLRIRFSHPFSKQEDLPEIIKKHAGVIFARYTAVTQNMVVKYNPKDITTEEIFSGKKVIMFAVPGAFTPGCSMTHLPGYVVNADKIKAAGVDSIVCMSVNDAFVMGAWGEASKASSRGATTARRRTAARPSLRSARSRCQGAASTA